MQPQRNLTMTLRLHSIRINYSRHVLFTFISAFLTGGIIRITTVTAASVKMYAPLYAIEYGRGDHPSQAVFPADTHISPANVAITHLAITAIR